MPDQMLELRDSGDDSKGPPIVLTRVAPADGTPRPKDIKPVLLVHGASANRETFRTPKGQGLADYLAQHGFDPWLLDWRGSSIVVNDHAAHLKGHQSLYNFNEAAAHDIPIAVTRVRDEIRKETGQNVRLGVVGHCMGSAIIAEAVASRKVTAREVDCIVLSALGLFYETPIDSRLKSEERTLERLIASGDDEHLSINPRIAGDDTLLPQSEWPPELEEMYKSWPTRLRFHRAERDMTELGDAEKPIARCREMCNRASFMYGVPYRHEILADEIHGTKSTAPVLDRQFGAIPVHMYLHAARNIRRGHATIFDPRAPQTDLLSDDARASFGEFDKVTLITGALNRLWHRDSIDLMYEWLCRGSSTHRHKFHKRIFPDYGHQDLLWGRKSERDVFPTIESGLQA